MSDLDKLHAICGKTYKEQACWFLNCFWEEFAEKEAELFWQYVQKSAELDLQDHAQGAGLDEMKAHVFLVSERNSFFRNSYNNKEEEEENDLH